ncbi:hypothetical protein SAMN05421737_102245 [Shouchella lonarensis]|uniref:Uncharacterized protein n=1 Tax=Shouchella lonarensis TaxID=1464122 RepID=A0A1G6H1P3_9BACI|nr:hypothetical protein SAMN05421737_102245 [Shouchella lonarensis]
MLVYVEAEKNIKIAAGKIKFSCKRGVIVMDLVEIKQELTVIEKRLTDFRGSL